MWCNGNRALLNIRMQARCHWHQHGRPLPPAPCMRASTSARCRLAPPKQHTQTHTHPTPPPTPQTILYRGQTISVTRFEALSGREVAKKWKQSLYSVGPDGEPEQVRPGAPGGSGWWWAAGPPPVLQPAALGNLYGPAVAACSQATLVGKINGRGLARLATP